MEFLHCKCDSCTHWELARENGEIFLVCKTCDLLLPVVFGVDDHEMLHWTTKE